MGYKVEKTGSAGKRFFFIVSSPKGRITKNTGAAALLKHHNKLPFYNDIAVEQ
jgi:hypothetical protein